MKKGKQLQKTVKHLIEASFKDGKVVESQAFRSITAIKSLPVNESIRAMSDYLKGLKRKIREHTIYIETVIPLSASQIEKVKKIVEKKSLPAGRQVKITKIITKINPALLGGFKLKVGDDIVDESIAGKINQVKEVIIHGRPNQSN